MHIHRKKIKHLSYYVVPTWRIVSDERGEVADEANDQSKALVAAAARY